VPLGIVLIGEKSDPLDHNRGGLREGGKGPARGAYPDITIVAAIGKFISDVEKKIPLVSSLGVSPEAFFNIYTGRLRKRGL